MQASHKPLEPDSQNSRILAHLCRGHTLTALSALRRFDCLRLGGRILELRRRGWKIKTEITAVESGKRIAKYSLPA